LFGRLDAELEDEASDTARRFGAFLERPGVRSRFVEPSLREARSALAAALERGDVAAAATFERGTYLVLHRRAVDGTWQRAVDVLDPDEPQGSSPHPQGGKK